MFKRKRLTWFCSSCGCPRYLFTPKTENFVKMTSSEIIERDVFCLLRHLSAKRWEGDLFATTIITRRHGMLFAREKKTDVLSFSHCPEGKLQPGIFGTHRVTMPLL